MVNMESDKTLEKVTRWLQKVPFVVQQDRKKGIQDNPCLNIGFEDESTGENLSQNYLHLTESLQSDLAGAEYRQRYNDGITLQSTVGVDDIRAGLTQDSSTNRGQCVARSNPTATVTETLDITALDTGDNARHHYADISDRIYMRGIVWNDFDEDDVRYISWKNVIIKNANLISFSLTLIIIILIIMGVLIALVKHDHIPSQDGG